MQYSEEAQRCDQGEAYIASHVPVSACSRSLLERIECSMLRKSQSKSYFQSNQYSSEVQLADGLTIRKATLLKLSFRIRLFLANVRISGATTTGYGLSHTADVRTWYHQMFVHQMFVHGIIKCSYTCLSFCLHKSPSLDAAYYQQTALYIAVHEFWALKLFTNRRTKYAGSNPVCL